MYNQGTAEKQLSIADAVIPVEKSQKKKKLAHNSRKPLNRKQIAS